MDRVLDLCFSNRDFLLGTMRAIFSRSAGLDLVIEVEILVMMKAFIVEGDSTLVLLWASQGKSEPLKFYSWFSLLSL